MLAVCSAAECIRQILLLPSRDQTSDRMSGEFLDKLLVFTDEGLAVCTIIHVSDKQRIQVHVLFICVIPT